MVSQVEAMLEALAASRTCVGLESRVSSKVAPQVRSVTEALATFAAVKGDPRRSGRWRWPWGSNRGRNHRHRGVIHGGRSGGGLGLSLEYRRDTGKSPLHWPSLPLALLALKQFRETLPELSHAHHQAATPTHYIFPLFTNPPRS